MKKFLYLLISIWLCLGSTVLAQNPEWITYNTSNSGLPTNSVHSIAIDENENKWIGTSWGGLAKFDGTNWTVYDTSNSGLPDNSVNCIALESNGNMWIGTGSFFTPLIPGSGGLAKFDDTTWTVYNTGNSSLPSYEVRSITIDGIGNKWIGTSWGGLAKFDDTNWTIYNTSNSGLPSDNIISLTIDESSNKWIGTHNYGLAKFDDTNWSVYNTSNSGLPDNSVWSLAIDVNGNKWIGTHNYGLAKFDGTTWTVYNTSNSGLPDNYISSIAIDGSGSKWICTGGGLAKFDDTNPGGTGWAVYDTSNSGLPSNGVWSLAIDGSGNKWIGTYGGLAVYNEGGIVSVEENQIREIIPNEYLLYQNYPNPFNPSTTIKYQIPGQARNDNSFVTLKIYDVLGSEVASLVNQKQKPGNYEVSWDASRFSSGVYFYKLSAGNYVETKKMILLR